MTVVFAVPLVSSVSIAASVRCCSDSICLQCPGVLGVWLQLRCLGNSSTSGVLCVFCFYEVKCLVLSVSLVSY